MKTYKQFISEAHVLTEGRFMSKVYKTVGSGVKRGIRQTKKGLSIVSKKAKKVFRLIQGFIDPYLSKYPYINAVYSFDFDYDFSDMDKAISYFDPKFVAKHRDEFHKASVGDERAIGVLTSTIMKEYSKALGYVLEFAKKYKETQIKDVTEKLQALDDKIKNMHVFRPVE